MIYGYIRVSTDKQDCENQKLGIESKASALGLCIDKYIEDAGISGTKEPERGMLRKLNPGDVIICSELSRLGRKMFMIMRILEHCMKIGARLYTVKDGYELGDTIQSKVLAFAFGLSAEIERNLIAQRTKEAMAKLRIQGIKLGRPCGQKNTCHIIDGHEDLILNMYSAGVSKRKIARTIRVSPPTISRFLESQKGTLYCSKIVK